MKKTLQQSGLKTTQCRNDILALMSEDDEPISAESINKKLKEKYDLVTIYRNLDIFEKKEMVFKENIGRIDYYYLADSPHHHIVCRICNLMTCLPCTHETFNIKNFSKINHQLVLTGVCNQCGAEN